MRLQGGDLVFLRQLNYAFVVESVDIGPTGNRTVHVWMGNTIRPIAEEFIREGTADEIVYYVLNKEVEYVA